MTYHVVLTDRAARDLDEAYRWCAERAPGAATRRYNGFLDALNTLGSNPERCPIAVETRTVRVEIRQLLYGRRQSYRALFLM
jgi:plasmid stabilization system protein ParE